MPLTDPIVVVDTSPIGYLAAIGELQLLRHIFDRVLIPEAVQRELMAGKETSPGFKQVIEEEWIEVKQIHNPAGKELPYD